MNRATLNNISLKKLKPKAAFSCLALTTFIVMSAVHSPAVLSQVDNINPKGAVQENTERRKQGNGKEETSSSCSNHAT